jgi:hypothetical protein
MKSTMALAKQRFRLHMDRRRSKVDQTVVFIYRFDYKSSIIDSLRCYTHLKTCIDNCRKKSIRIPDGGLLLAGSNEHRILHEDMQQICKSLSKNLMQRTEYFQLGEKCFVLGKPFRRKDGSVHIYADEVLPDYGVSRDREIEWKDLLINLYKTYK